MTNDIPNDGDFYSEPDETPQSDDSDAVEGPKSQEIKHNQVSALVPESVAGGVFSTGAVVLGGAHEFVLDFLLRMQQPQQVAARIILPPTVIPQFLQALAENIRKFEERFGEIHDPVKAMQKQKKPNEQASAQDLYDSLKLPEDVMSGTYANAVMIGHSAYEFSFDFITTFFPRSAVACRVYLTAPNVPRLLDSLRHSFKQFQEKQQRPPHDPFETGTFGD
ncbi:MAG: DUF3467 domain-containing protein [Planctomycetaceae bacterium]